MRYKVEPIDNCGSVEGLVRDRTWAVVDRTTGACVSEHARRDDARIEATMRNTEVAS